MVKKELLHIKVVLPKKKKCVTNSVKVVAKNSAKNMEYA